MLNMLEKLTKKDPEINVVSWRTSRRCDCVSELLLAGDCKTEDAFLLLQPVDMKTSVTEVSGNSRCSTSLTTGHVPVWDLVIIQKGSYSCSFYLCHINWPSLQSASVQMCALPWTERGWNHCQQRVPGVKKGKRHRAAQDGEKEKEDKDVWRRGEKNREWKEWSCISICCSSFIQETEESLCFWTLSVQESLVSERQMFLLLCSGPSDGE